MPNTFLALDSICTLMCALYNITGHFVQGWACGVSHAHEVLEHCIRAKFSHTLWKHTDRSVQLAAGCLMYAHLSNLALTRSR